MKYGIFIIESLNQQDDKDGRILHDILNVCRIQNEYHAVNTKEEFIETISKFKESEYRYLHLSFHGNTTGFALSNETFITNSNFSGIISNNLEKRRIFMSACETGNFDLAGKLITKNRIFSLIGSPVPIRFDKAVLFYPTFYHLMNELDEKEMNKDALKKSLRASADLFKIPIHYYAFLRKDKIWNETEIREYIFYPEKELINERKAV